jgi:hypothetical protein
VAVLAVEVAVRVIYPCRPSQKPFSRSWVLACGQAGQCQGAMWFVYGGVRLWRIISVVWRWLPPPTTSDSTVIDMGEKWIEILIAVRGRPCSYKIARWNMATNNGPLQYSVARNGDVSTALQTKHEF